MIIAVRIRGKIGIRQQVKDTFQMLRMKRTHSAVLLPETPIYKGMLEKVKDYIMYGKISPEVLKKLLAKRLKRKDNKKADNKLIEKTIKTINENKLLKDVNEIKPFLALHPARKGLKKTGTKKTVKRGGSLGWHDSMDDLILRMI